MFNLIIVTRVSNDLPLKIIIYCIYCISEKGFSVALYVKRPRVADAMKVK